MGNDVPGWLLDGVLPDSCAGAPERAIGRVKAKSEPSATLAPEPPFGASWVPARADVVANASAATGP